MKKIYFTWPKEITHRYGSMIAINLLARSICENLKKSSIVGASIPDFFIFNEPYENLKEKENDRNLLRIKSASISTELIAHIINQAEYNGAIIETSALWYPNFRSQKSFLQNKANKLLQTRAKNKLFELDFLIHLRLGDFTDPLFHKKETHFPLNIDYYKKITDQAGVIPTFIGQLTKSKYLDNLKKEFPKSEFHDPDPLTTFLSIMTAKKKILSLSSFCWFAAWSGNDNTKIHLPVTGIYDPINSNHFLMPFDDERYIFDYIDKNKLKNSRLDFITKLKKLYKKIRLRYIVTRYPEN